MSEKNIKNSYEIVIEAKRIQGKKDDKEYDFLSFEGYENSGRRVRFIFTKNCDNVPTEVGMYKMTVKKQDISRDKYNRYSRYYIRKISHIEKYDNVIDNDEDLDF